MLRIYSLFSAYQFEQCAELIGDSWHLFETETEEIEMMELGEACEDMIQLHKLAMDWIQEQSMNDQFEFCKN